MRPCRIGTRPPAFIDAWYRQAADVSGPYDTSCRKFEPVIEETVAEASQECLEAISGSWCRQHSLQSASCMEALKILAKRAVVSASDTPRRFPNEEFPEDLV